MLKNFTFLHIPKNAGTTIETFANKLNIELVVAPPWVTKNQILLNISKINQISTKKKGVPYSWHLPPDLFEKYYKISRSPNKKEILCVVREPKERLASIIKHTNTVINFRKTMIQIHKEIREVSTCKYRKDILHQSLHLLPQHWYVWSEKGIRQCDCVVSFDKIKHITKMRVRASVLQFNLSSLPSLSSVYDLDYVLWLNASRSSSFCYRPEMHLNI